MQFFAPEYADQPVAISIAIFVVVFCGDMGEAVIFSQFSVEKRYLFCDFFVGSSADELFETLLIVGRGILFFAICAL